ncbi:MAG: TPM domain-containing protein, partial [Brachymonas sp.]|nr:TPM domain-containing protein [Brachymonas sp.]
MPLLHPATAATAPAPRPLNAARASHAAPPPCHLLTGQPARAGAADGAGHWRDRLRCLRAALAWLALWLVPLPGLLGPGLSLAQGVQPVPTLTARVIDQTGTLSEADKAALEAKLAAYERDKGSQIVVLMVPSTQPEDIASYAHRVASNWKIGRRDVGDGVLLIVAKDDRRMRIEVA